MLLTQNEQEQINRIKLKTKKISDERNHREVFGEQVWNYKWPKPIKERKILAFERKHKLGLPREYRAYLLHIANGGPALGYGLYSLKEAVVEPNVDSEPFFEPSIDFPAIYDVREHFDFQNRAEDYYRGLMIILTEGCTDNFYLVLNGKNKGRIIRTDYGVPAPIYYEYDSNFLNWYERWLDDYINGMEMDNIDILNTPSVPGAQKELRQKYLDSNHIKYKYDLLYSLSRFPIIEDETFALLKSVCKTTKEKELFDLALRILVIKRKDLAYEILSYYLESKNPIKVECAIMNMHLGIKRGLEISSFCDHLLKLIPTLSNEGFKYALYVLIKSDKNQCKTYLPFLKNCEAYEKVTVIYALSKASDFIGNDEQIDVLAPFFLDQDKEVVRTTILALFNIKSERVRKLIDDADKRVPELHQLCENYRRKHK